MNASLSRFLCLFTLISNVQIGLLINFVPKEDKSVIYFSQSHDSKLLQSLNNANGIEQADVARAAGADHPDRAPHSAARRNSGQHRNIRSTTDGNCGVSGDQIDSILMNKFHFNDSNFNLAILWTGEDSKELLALTTMEYGFFAAQSHLWLSLDYGKTFTNIDDRVEGAIIRRENGVFKSPLDPKKVILVSYMSDMDDFGSKFYISEDGGRTFNAIILPFLPEGEIHFHPTNPNLMFVRTPNDESKLWLSKDFGSSWSSLKSRVEQASWASPEMNAENRLFLLQYEEGSGGGSMHLLMTPDLGKSYQTLQTDVQNFGLRGRFIYAAIDSKEGSDSVKQHILHVSTDLGGTWHPTQLPVITSDRFFSVLDMSEGLIFMHVDDPGNTGTGTIYTSAADGIVFSRSLARHLFPNGHQITDFYRVDSMRGVYMASQIHEDSTIHTVITYDRGGIWAPIHKPVGVPCTDEGECYLQIHNQYSKLKGVNFPSGPLSDNTATGLILAHATVANGLEVRPPDVYVSSDGGYNWKLALEGPHFFAITNSGGLLVAIPTTETATDTIKFSYDEGQCWNSYRFSDEQITVTGLLPEPSKKSLNISIWGFGAEDSQWRSFMIDFGAILQRECSEDDFKLWKPHEGNGQAGCLLGQKETYKRVRADAVCRVGFEFEQVVFSSQPCSCGKADYECDYGFYRPENSTECILSPDFQHRDLEYCLNGREEEIKTWGYRKIPGDICTGGYQPQRDVERLKARCNGASQSKGHSVAVGIIITLLVLIILGGCFILYRKKKFTCLQRSSGTYRYTQLGQGDSVDSKALDMTDSLQGYHDDSDEDMLD